MLGTEEEIEQRQHQPMFPLRLESLELESCGNLDKLQGFHSLTSLRKLTIRSCPKLVALPTTLKYHNTFLEEIRIFNCENLKSLPEGIHNLTRLSRLDISQCPSLVSFPNGGLPTTLKYLSVRDCPKLEFVVERFHHNTFLEVIHIRDCEKLQALPDCIYNLTSLETLQIWECGGIVSFPNGGLPATKLRCLQIWKCEKLEVLPHLQNLTSLQHLDISNCPRIVSFPGEGFPTNLTSLEIYDLKILDSIIDWDLRRLTSLKRLFIGGPYPDLMSFPEEDDRMMLPTSLTDLTIRDFPNLKYLSSKADAFRNLTSLETLEIENCPKLKFFPKKGLPLSLLRLDITNCPLLLQQYKRDQGRDWPKISHIPRVLIV